MTSKEKAQNLFNKYHNSIQEIGEDLGQEIIVSVIAKQCALIAVEEIIYNTDGMISYNFESYWHQVKQEIENL